MSPPQNARSALHTRRALPTNSRPAKPPPLTSKKSSTGTPSKKSPTTKAGPGWSKSSKREVVADPEEDDMTGLPQYCTTCEKQILTPGNSMLYCSESCRKKDHNKPLQDSILPQESPSASSSRRTSSYYSGDDAASDTSSLRSPASIRPPSIAFSDSSDSSYYDSRLSYGRNESEAAHYLSQFTPFDSAYEQGTSHDRKRLSTSSSLAPSLSHTPTSVMSTSGSYRPLPRRGDPFSASFSTFSVDLITPVINIESSNMPSNTHCRNASVGSTDSTNTAFHTSERDVAYGKKSFMPSNSMTHGSLRQLFTHGTTKAPSADDEIDPKDKRGHSSKH